MSEIEECQCSIEWLVQKPDEHETQCLDFMIENFNNELAWILRRRVKWHTTPSWRECNAAYSHGPHGGCTGQSFDRT